MATWLEDIVTALTNLGGAAHYNDLYEEIKRVRKQPVGGAWKKIIQRQIQDHAVDSTGFKSKPLFYSVDGKGAGVWALIEQPAFGADTGQSDSHTESGIKVRNAAWSRDELILALDLYLSQGDNQLTKESVEVAELSEFLNQLGTVLGTAANTTFRNANGVYMKLMNFRRFDPAFASAGKSGLTRGNKDEQLVWDEFASDPVHLANVAKAIRLGVSASLPGTLMGDDEAGISEAEEGRILTRIHRVRERSRALVEERKKMSLKVYGHLKCEACDFDFADMYGAVGHGIIEVHHTKPVHTLTEGEKTKLDDLALLCANCHRVIHSSRKWLSIDQVKDIVKNAAGKV